MQSKNNFMLFFSDERQLSDQLFFFAFYICIGLLPALIGIFGHKAIHIPLLVISGLVFIRFLLRANCRQRMIGIITAPGILVLIMFTALLATYATSGIIEDFDRLRLIGKPITIALFVIVLAFTLSHKDRLDKGVFFKLALMGLALGGIITGLKIFANYFMDLETRTTINALTNFLHVDDMINDQLKILTVLVFAIVTGIETPRRRYSLLVGISIMIFVASFYVTGPHQYGGQDFIVPIYSETVQFGLPFALLVFALSLIAPRIMTNLFFGGLVIFLVGAPWLFQWFNDFIKISSLPRATKFLTRGEIWDMSAIKVLESPLFGHGIDSARYLKFISVDSKYFKNDAIHHPHNMILQVWLDLGFVGIMLVLGILYLSWRFISRLELSKRPPILGGLAMMLVFVIATHSAWQTWSMSLIFYCCVYVLLADLSSDSRRKNQAIE